MTLHKIFLKLRRQNKGQYLMLGFCIALSVLLVTAFALMYYGPTIQDFLPIGGDTRKLASLLLAVTMVGCTIFTVYASALFFRYKSREYGVLLALGTPKKSLKPILFQELATVIAVGAIIGLVLSIPFSFVIWKLFETLLLPAKEMVYRFGWGGFIPGFGFCIVLAILLFLSGTRFIRKSNIMDILHEQQKTEMVKEIPSWTGRLGFVLMVTGIFLGIGLPVIISKVFYYSLPSAYNLVYFVALAGIYLFLLSLVAQNSAGKNKEKYYKNLVSISLMRFTAKAATRNMCVTAMLLFCCLFAAFFGMLYSTVTGTSKEESKKAFTFHFPADEQQINQKDIQILADKYNMSIIDYHEKEAANLVISYRQRDLTDANQYVTLESDNARFALFFSESDYESLSGQDVTIKSGTYKTITAINYKETIFDFIDGLYEVTNPDSRQTFTPGYDGSIEFNAFSDMSEPYAYVLADNDYQSITKSLDRSRREKIISFDVKDPEHSYEFAKALEMEYLKHASSLSDCMKYYDAWEDQMAREEGRTYSYAGSIGLSPDMEQIPDDWKYAPRLLPVIRQEYLQKVAVYVMLCIYIFIIMLASVSIMSYVRGITIAIDNKDLFQNLEKLGADPDYRRNILKKQLRKIFQYPVLIGSTAAWVFALFMSYFNDTRFTVEELMNLGTILLLILGIWGFFSFIYAKTCKKAIGIIENK